MIEETLCPECNEKMVSRTGKYGTFWGCTKYPKCKGTRDSMGRSREEARAERDKENAVERESEDARENSRYRFRKDVS